MRSGHSRCYLSLISQGAPQRKYELREVYNALKWLVRSGSPWRYLPNDFPRWEAVYQQTQRWLEAGVFEAMAHDLRELLRIGKARKRTPTGVILDSRTLQSTPESGSRAGYDGAKRKNGSKIHIAVDTLGHLLAAVVTPASEQDRTQVEELAKRVWEVTGESVEVAWVDQGYTGEGAQEAAAKQGVKLVVVKHERMRRGFVLLPRRWVVERSFAWMARFRRLAKDYDLRESPWDERLPAVLAGLHFVAFSCLLLKRVAPMLTLVASA